MYADYSYYLTGFPHTKAGPVIVCEDFPVYSEQATIRMDYLTGGRITDNLAEAREIKSCCCEMAEAIYKYEKARENDAAAPITSWNNDGESGSYDMSSSEVTEDGHNKQIGKIARKYLLRYGLLNRGCRCESKLYPYHNSI